MNFISTLISYPLSLCYAAVVQVRNKLYDWRLFKSTTFRLPVIAVGNITVGGTGKTPHTEWLASALKNTTTVAVLSRGYKRKTKGFRYVETTDTVQQAGDEPLQMKRKNPELTVAVDADRVAGIQRLLHDCPTLGAVILDDAFQHRKVCPALSILLIDYNRPIYADHYLPYGRLRDSLNQKNRAEVVIVTKCPAHLKPIERRLVTKHLHLYPYQQLYFTTFVYGAPKPVFAETGALPVSLPPVVAITGIADPTAFITHLKSISSVVQHLKFADHHAFTPRNAAQINAVATAHPHALFVTTEKDAQRLRTLAGLHETVKQQFFYIPVAVAFLSEADETKFTKRIIDCVKTKIM